MSDKIQISIATLLLFVIIIGGALIPAPDIDLVDNNFEFDVVEMIELANQLSIDLSMRQYDNVVSNFAPNVAEVLSKENLEINWLYTAGNIGKFQGLSATDVVVDGETITVKDTLNFDSRAAVVNYTFNKDKKIEGIWFSTELLLPVAESTEVFYEEIIQVGYNENKMNGLITIPLGVENPPVVILVHGSGSYDLNESIGANRPFYDIAHGLAEYGIATIRYDKRHAVYPDELPALVNANNFTIEDEVTKDVDSIIKQIQNIDTVDSDRIYVLGHSLGGMLAPKIATENEEVVGIISMAGTLRSIEDIILSQNEETIESMTMMSDEEKTILLDSIKQEINLIKSLTAESTDIIMGYPASYWYSYQVLDNINLAKNLDIPVLVLQGTDDFQILIDVDYPLWEETLSNNENAVFKTYEGLNHLMMQTSGLRNIGDYEVEGNVSEEVIADIAEFIA